MHSIVMRSLQTTGEVRLDNEKRNILGRSARRWPAPPPGQTALRRFRLAYYAKLSQIWAAREGYPANAGFLSSSLTATPPSPVNG